MHLNNNNKKDQIKKKGLKWCLLTCDVTKMIHWQWWWLIFDKEDECDWMWIKDTKWTLSYRQTVQLLQ